ncbi:uncharacterized protein [Rutidosis leptorrhynchoides]|uniref:uncharacterized protein n=1 Tax=Rutidosis leptorrhynchoides TaxID=125765 RepID=UPI003A98E843
MKIISYNIRTFGSGKESKFGSIKKFIAVEKPSFFALQETKLKLVDKSWIESLLGSTSCEFIQQEKIGKSSGQLLIWDTNLFDASDVIRIDRVIGVRGVWKNNYTVINTLNVYGPHDDNGKSKLWDSLSSIIGNSDEAWALCGDFNEVRKDDERLNFVFIESRAKRFNDFINSNSLSDIPMGGRCFTHVSEDGLKFSKIDRFLVSDKFMALWNNLSAVIMDRSDSDHCPISLFDEVKKFGPKPIKVFDSWLDDPEAENIISSSWANPPLFLQAHVKTGSF